MPSPRASRRLALLALPLTGLLGVAACASLRSQPVPVVFFPEDSATIDPPGRAVVAQAAALAKDNPLLRVRVMGYAAAPSDPDAARQLATQRAQAVAAELQADGVSSGRISLQPRGPVPYEQSRVEARRVEIRIGDQ